jgi:hypothetical protein
MADKPIISTPRGEWDARSLVLADQEILNGWPDISGANNDMTPTGGAPTYQAVGGVGTPWSDTLPAVRMDDSPANDQFGGVGNFGGAGSAFTLFAVAEATDLLQSGMAFWGSLDGTVIPTGPLGIYLFIGTDGAVGLVIGAINVTLLLSQPGLVGEGDRVIITARRIATQGPALLRVNGVEVSSSSNSGLVGSWPSKRMHRCNLQSNFGFPGDIEGADGLYAHLIEYGSAASDEEILQMEAFLEEVWFPGPWVPSGKQFDFAAPVVADKPDLANPEVEYDARTLPLILNDGDPVVTWADQSGNGNDAVDAPAPAEQPTLRLDRWAPGSGIPSVEFLDFGTGPPSREEAMDYDAQTPYRGAELTIFIVGRIIDLSEGGAFVGTRTGATPPREIDVCVFPTGEILFGFGTETIPTAVQTNIITAPGTVKEGEKLLITVRSTGGSAGVDPEGMLIRLNGQQVASATNFVTPPINVVGAGGIQQGAIGRSQNTGSPELGLPGGTIWGLDRLIAWIGGYSAAATNDEILEMERFLHDTFGFDFLRKWAPQVPPSTTWTPN